MAVLNEDPNLDPAQQGQPGQTGGSGFIGGGAAGGTGATTTKAPTSSGSYTNLSQYIGANQGNDATMGKAAANTVGQVGQATDKAIGDYGAGGAADAKAGTANVDPNVVNSIKGGTTSGGTEYVGPSSVTAGYSGPKGLTDWGADTGGAAGAQSSAYQGINNLIGTKNSATGQYQGGIVGKASGGQAGVGSLLRDTYTQPSYTGGENQLDSFLTGAGPGGQAALKGIQSQWGGEGGKLDKAEAGIGAAETAGQKTSDATQKTYSDTIANTQKAADYQKEVNYQKEVDYQKEVAYQKEVDYQKEVAYQKMLASQQAAASAAAQAAASPPTLGTTPMQTASTNPIPLQTAAGDAAHVVGDVVSAAKQLSPGQLNHAAVNAATAAAPQLSQAGAPIQAPSPQAIAASAPTPAQASQAGSPIQLPNIMNTLAQVPKVSAPNFSPAKLGRLT